MSIPISSNATTLQAAPTSALPLSKEIEAAVGTPSDPNPQALRSYLNQAQSDAGSLRFLDGGGQTDWPRPVEPTPEDLTEVQSCFAPVDFRGPEAQAAIFRTLALLQQFEREAAAEGQPLEIDGYTASELYMAQFARNRNLSDEQLIKMSQVNIPPRDAETREYIEEQHPNSRQLPSHRMAVALLAAITGRSPEDLSAGNPDLGLSGTPGLAKCTLGAGLWEPTTPGHAIATALHDTTDFLQDAGAEGVNEAVWVDSASWTSAITSYDWGAYDNYPWGAPPDTVKRIGGMIFVYNPVTDEYERAE